MDILMSLLEEDQGLPDDLVEMIGRGLGGWHPGKA
jgi:hypothetical protein